MDKDGLSSDNVAVVITIVGAETPTVNGIVPMIGKPAGLTEVEFVGFDLGYARRREKCRTPTINIFKILLTMQEKTMFEEINPQVLPDN